MILNKREITVENLLWKKGRGKDRSDWKMRKTKYLLYCLKEKRSYCGELALEDAMDLS
jgi:hypothetical protein